ncbi:hypothetical protein BDB00DRAFT_227769 [Zychaea mexicana]|uniref:uncharacterized protein n=1 Tax=Zychaea mexicana TaxID=64656 RepID=UPI0022FF3004|nr:uncharacterized protein BDB00DRAFT_227769 [Zychaea mexicana]KAI9499288.1 hypothetical protein BDB00DRAFT_227769 [Zychaea mexicana]
MNNYLSMDRASEAAARDLAEVRKLIEGMSAFVTSQAVQQQQQQSSPQTTTTAPATTTTTTASLDRHPTPSYPTSQPQQQPSGSLLQDTASLMAAAATAAAAVASSSSSSTTVAAPTSAAAAAAAAASPTTTTPAPATGTTTTTTATPQTTPSAPPNDPYSAQPPANGIVVQVDHLMYNRVLYFQLSPDATIEPLITGLRLSFHDTSISGMVLQYKGFDGLWKCLLNRDDSLKRILKQGFKSQTMLQMRVPREQDLLSVRNKTRELS